MGNACSSGAGKTPVESTEEPKDDVPAEDAPAGAAKLTIKIMGARGLRNADWFPGAGASDCFCKVKVVGAAPPAEGEEETCLMKTQTINNTLTPIWQEEQEIEGYNDGDSLEFSVWDEDTAKAPDLLGKVVLKKEDFAESGFNGELKLEESKNKTAGRQAILRLKLKMPGQTDYPAGPPQEFNVKIENDPKDKKKVKMQGLECDDADGKTLYVTKVNQGPFANYNKSADVNSQLRLGDFIMSVNGKEGDAKAMMEELKTKTDFEVKAVRAEEIIVAIDKKDAKMPLGIELPKKPMGNALLIAKLGDGPFKEWNDTHGGEHQKVYEGDRIMSVGGASGQATTLQKKLTGAKAPFQAVIVRPYHPEKSWSLF